MTFPKVLAFVRERLIYVWIVSIGLWLSWWGWLLFTTLGVIVDDDKVFTDHMAFYAGARLISEGRGEIIYDYDRLGFEQRKFVGYDDGKHSLTAIRNPPFYFLLYLPTAGLPYLASFWIWSIISLLMLYVGFLLLGVERPLLAMAWATSFYPVFTTISFGQNSLLSFGVMCGVYWCLKRDRKVAAGMLVGLLSFKPTVMLGLLIWWLLDVRRYWRCWFGLILTGAILLAITLLFVRKEFEIFLSKLGEIAAYDLDDFFNHHTMRAFWTYLFGNDKALGLKFGAATSLVLTVAFVFFWYRHHTPSPAAVRGFDESEPLRVGSRPSDLPILFGGTIYFTLMVSPHALVYEWSLILIPAVIWWREYPENRDRWLVLYAVPWVVLLTGTQAAKYQSQWFGGFAIHFSPLILSVMGFVFARELDRLSALRRAASEPGP